MCALYSLHSRIRCITGKCIQPPETRNAITRITDAIVIPVFLRVTVKLSRLLGFIVTLRTAAFAQAAGYAELVEERDETCVNWRCRINFHHAVALFFRRLESSYFLWPIFISPFSFPHNYDKKLASCKVYGKVVTASIVVSKRIPVAFSTFVPLNDPAL